MRVKRLLTAGAMVMAGLLTVPVQVQAAAQPSGKSGSGHTGFSHSEPGDKEPGTTSTGARGSGTTWASATTRGQDGPTANATIGSVDVRADGAPITEPPIARCKVDGVPSGGTRGVEVSDIAEYGSGQTDCIRNSNGTVTAQTSGRRFTLTALREFGGPRIGLRTYSSSCSTTNNGSSGRMEISGVTGIDVPERIPANYTVYVPGEDDGDPPLAKVIVNETVTPDPPNGDLTVNVLRVELFPQGGGPRSGDVIVGSVSCYPFGQPAGVRDRTS